MNFHCPTHGEIEDQFLKNAVTKKQRTKDQTKEVWLISKTCPQCGQDVYATKPEEHSET